MEGFWGTLLGAAIAFSASYISHASAGRRWAKDREDRQYAEAIAMARIVEAADESELAKAIAKERLRTLGVTETWVEEVRQHERQRRGWELFGPPAPGEDDLEAVERALKSETIKPDKEIEYVLKAMNWVDQAFDRARADARVEEDTRVRILLLLLTFAFTFVVLAIAATLRALGL